MSQTSHDEHGESRKGLASLGVCRLGLLDGLGELKLVRATGGTVLRGSGVWQPSEELGYDDLRELFRPGAFLLYQGPASDETAGDGVWHEVRLEVEVTSVERCTDGAGGNGALVGGGSGGGVEAQGDHDAEPRGSLIRLQINAEDQPDNQLGEGPA